MGAENDTVGAEPGSAEVKEYHLAGLEQPVEIILDLSGIPHLYAESTEDVFFAQGFNVARDRLFQIDLWRRRGLGRLSEVFGPSFIEQDRATRLLLYRGDMDAEWDAYGADAHNVASRFTAGINAYVGWLAAYPEALPREFRMLGYEPAIWAPEDVVRIRSHGLTANLPQEVQRARAFHAGGVPADRIRRKLRPKHTPEPPEGLDLDLPEGVLDVYTLATQSVAFTGDPNEPLAVRPTPAAVNTSTDPAAYGSNNWTISGGRTTTGRPILANDPHRSHTTPSLRYIIHLCAPGLDVIGAGEPTLPGVSIGHNGTIAFGMTIFAIDAQDLYAYELDPTDHSRYRYGEGWEVFRTEVEYVAVQGGPPREVELRFSLHGPVLYVDERAHRAYAVRTVWAEPGTAAYFGSIDYMRVKDWDEFVTAMSRWGTPGENQVYADTAGNIGWKPAGLVPRRPNWDGLLPVPGDGSYEWDGFRASDEIPVSFNPAEGFVATANEYNLPEEFPRDRQIAYEWADPARFERIQEVLSGLDQVSVEDAMWLQNDVTSSSARAIVEALKEIEATNGADRVEVGSTGSTGSTGNAEADGSVGTVEADEAALALLRDWDGVEAADSGPAALYEVWLSRHLRPGLVIALLGADADTDADADADAHTAWDVRNADTQVVREAIVGPTRWFDNDPARAIRARDRLVRVTLAAAYAETRTLLGADPTTWRWGDLHQCTLKHSLHAVDPSLSVGPLRTGGSGSTPGAATYEIASFAHTAGASFRMVLDVGEWDNSRVINTPGQSGDPDSPHYRDLAPKWQAGKYVPLPYTRAAVESLAERRIRLLPAP